MVSLEESYQHCRNVARNEARNFYYSFTVLPPERRAAMCAIYAFMRHSDDLSDEQGFDNRRERVAEWRRELNLALSGEYGNSPILPAFHDTVIRYRIPSRYLHELIDGIEMDLTTTRYPRFEDARLYCYRVASTVGFICLYIWGFHDEERAIRCAEHCGVAFQWTNILRDLREDAERGRIYLPIEDLERFHYSEQELLNGVINSAFRNLMRFEVERAKLEYRAAMPLLKLVDQAGLPTLRIMMRIYQGILEQIEQLDYDVFSQRARVSTPRKITIVAEEWLGSRLPGVNLLRAS